MIVHGLTYTTPPLALSQQLSAQRFLTPAGMGLDGATIRIKLTLSKIRENGQKIQATVYKLIMIAQ